MHAVDSFLFHTLTILNQLFLGLISQNQLNTNPFTVGFLIGFFLLKHYNVSEVFISLEARRPLFSNKGGIAPTLRWAFLRLQRQHYDWWDEDDDEARRLEVS
jgi:hypothetical protein